ncbi:hypothetical protein HWX41_27210 [Bacillus paramycoides]|uniref:hypothetical protein n=1 Tax=Bacillus paramycoides TaxID=2026194 RepID=UPI0015BB32CE|nr:hypothetical protein [Bacillus paramycoides]NWK72613.1 hypothetical protein [Bacillus paramycoides]
MFLKNKEKKDKRKSPNKIRNIYGITLCSFFTVLFFICISPLLRGANYEFEERKLNEYQSLTNDVKAAIVKKEYNPENKTLRIDYAFKSESNNSKSLSNLKFKVENRYINQETNDVKTKVFYPNDDYVVVISTNIPDDYGVIASTIKPEYKHPELENDPDDLKDRGMKTYIKDSQKMINENLKVQSLTAYEEEYIERTQGILNKEIKELEKKVELKTEANKQLGKNNEKLKTEMDFQTDDEKGKTGNEMKANETTINANKKEIETLKEEAKLKEKKIDLLNEKKKTVEKK